MWEAIKKAWNTEPVAILTALYVVIESAVALLVVFGLKLEPEQMTAILVFANSLGGLVLALIGRSQVTPVNRSKPTIRQKPNDYF